MAAPAAILASTITPEAITVLVWVPVTWPTSVPVKSIAARADVAIPVRLPVNKGAVILERLVMVPPLIADSLQ